MKKCRFFMVMALSLFVAVNLTTSCNDDLEDSETAEDLPTAVDPSKKNLCSKSSIVGEWEYVSSIERVVDDGELFTEFPVDFYEENTWVLNEDGTANIVVRGTSHRDTWKYNHNYIIFGSEHPIYCYEVLELTDDKMVLLLDGIPSGIPYVPYWKDKSGRHWLVYIEFKRQ